MSRPLSALCLAAAVAAASACATNPATGRRQLSLMSEPQEVQIGGEQDAQIRREMGVYADPALQQYVSEIGLRLARASERPDLPWHFTVVDVAAVNAFALPGGYIYITRGLLPFLEDEAQLAGVLGHEIGHVTARHAAQQYSRAMSAGLGLLLGSLFVPEARPFAEAGETGLGLLFLKYGRDDEVQADALGVRYAARAGWDPAAVPQMLATLGRIEEASDRKGVPNWLSTHPSPDNRVQRVQAVVDQAERGATRFAADRAGYLRRIDGLVYGDNPEQGVVRGRTFLHPGLRIALDFPDAWRVENGPTQVVATQPGANAVMLLEVQQDVRVESLEDAALGQMRRGGFQEISGAETTINSLNAYLGAYRGSLKDFGRVGVLAAHLVRGRSLFLVAGFASMPIYARSEAVFSQSIRTFRSLTIAEANAIRPNRIDLYTARDDDTWPSIARREGRGVVGADLLAIMNGRPPADPPRAGERLKIVVPG